MEYRKCFVPTCSNNTNNNPNKIFVRIREDLREKWCRDVGVEYCKVYTMYCCEDHFDMCRVCLAVDVKMYHMKDCELSDMFQKITGIAITENNHSLMELLCWECAARLKAAAAFRSKALLSDSLLQDLVTTGEQIRKTDITTIKEKHDIKSDLSFQEVFHIAHIEDNAEDEQSSTSENIDTEIVQNTMKESSTEFEDNNIEIVKKENIEMEIETDDEPMVYIKTEMETDEGDNIIDPLFNPSEDSVNFTCTSRERRNILTDPLAETSSRNSVNSTRTNGEGRNAVRDPLAETSSRDSINSTRMSREGRNIFVEPLAITSSRDSINSTRMSREGRNIFVEPLAITSSRDSINSTRMSGEGRNIVIDSLAKTSLRDFVNSICKSGKGRNKVVERHAKTQHAKRKPSRDKIVNLIYTSSGRSNLVVRTLNKKPPRNTVNSPCNGK